MQNVEAVSYLFELSTKSIGLEEIKTYLKEKTNIESIIFLAVELIGSIEERSYNSFYLTQILNRCYTAPVFILFRCYYVISFSGQTNFDGDHKSSNVFLSDWYYIYKEDISIFERLSEIFFENQSSNNLFDMYYDMLWAISRKYLIYPESLEYIKYGLLSNKYVCASSESIGNYQDYFNRESSFDQIKQLREYYQNIYGNDYIIDAKQMILKFDDVDDDNLLEMFDSLLMSETSKEDNFQEFEIDVDVDDLNNDVIEDIDASYFDDPIKTLKLFDD